MRSLLSKWSMQFAFCVASVLLISTQVQAATFYFHNDHLGTPQVLTDNTQQVVWKGEYDPFGKATETVSLVEQNIRFPGQYYDQETELHYNYFRSYNPVTGKYVESDPIGILRDYEKLLFSTVSYARDVEKSSLNNLFFYAGGNPLIYYDEFGLAESTDHLIFPPSTNCSCVIDCVETIKLGGAVGGLVQSSVCNRFTIPVIGGIICGIVISSACSSHCNGRCDLTCSNGTK